MEEFLKTLTGSRIDVFCGATSSLRGDVAKVENGILHLKDDDGAVCYVAIDKSSLFGKSTTKSATRFSIQELARQRLCVAGSQ